MDQALSELLIALLNVLVIGVGALGTVLAVKLKNFTQNKRVKAFFESENIVYDYILDQIRGLVLVAEKQVASKYHGLTKGEKYDFVYRHAVEFIEGFFSKKGVKLDIDGYALQTMIERAVAELDLETAFGDPFSKNAPGVPSQGDSSQEQYPAEERSV